MPRTSRTARSDSPILIRVSTTSDDAALERLAALEDRTLPAGCFLIAEVGGELIAAAPLDVEDEPLGDPFRPTADLCELLRLRARQIRQHYRTVTRRAPLRAATLREAA